MKKNNKIIYELVGLPAVGKTTVLTSLDLDSNFELVSTNAFYNYQHSRSRFKSAVCFLFFVLLHPIFVVKIMSRINFKRFKSTIRLCFFIYNFIRYINHSNAPIMVFDQGIIQYSWSLFWKSIDDQNIKREKALFNYLARFFDIIPIIVEDDYKEVAKRAYERKSECYVDHLALADILSLYKRLDFELNNGIKIFYENKIVFSTVDLLKNDLLQFSLNRE